MRNLVILIGNLGADPQMNQTQAGKSVANLNVATSMRWKDSSGQQQEKTEWHRVIVWDKAAEFCGNYLQKGSKVYVEGRLETRKWTDQQGADRYTTEIVASIVQNLSPRTDTDTRQPAPPVSEPCASTTGDDPPF